MLVGLYVGTVIGLVLIAWKTSVWVGCLATPVGVLALVWGWRHLPVHFFGPRISIFMDMPTSRGEYVVRFIFGSIAGGFLMFFFAADLWEEPLLWFGATAGFSLLCGVLAAVLGNRFWTRS